MIRSYPSFSKVTVSILERCWWKSGPLWPCGTVHATSTFPKVQTLARGIEDRVWTHLDLPRLASVFTSKCEPCTNAVDIDGFKD
jgi:hypothetical protein